MSLPFTFLRFRPLASLPSSSCRLSADAIMSSAALRLSWPTLFSLRARPSFALMRRLKVDDSEGAGVSALEFLLLVPPLGGDRTVSSLDACMFRPSSSSSSSSLVVASFFTLGKL
jgi:hypothetical protein